MLIQKQMIVAFFALLSAGGALAATTQNSASMLGNELTPLGAIKAGNSNGTIPEWEGGICEPVPGYEPKDARGGHPYVDPFADESPRFTITASNLDQYRDQLPEGTVVLLERFPDTYRVDVFPTHRTVCYPEYVYENTIKNVNKPRLVGDAPGLADSHAQIPFPIPETGQEVMWNVLVRYAGPNEISDSIQYLGDTAGYVSLVDANKGVEARDYWDNSLSYEEEMTFWELIQTKVAPASQAGSSQLRIQYIRADLYSPKAYVYIPGQRRVRMAPEFTYDTVSTASGVLLFDEINGFDGKMDKFDFKLLGRKEMIVPYNAYRRWEAPREAFNPGLLHTDPDAERWELHRVWVVEATLKEGERHTQSRKKFYVDEDSWAILAYVGFDQENEPHHYMPIWAYQEYEKPTFRSNAVYDLYDLSTGARASTGLPGPAGTGYLWPDEPHPPGTFTPGRMTGRGVR